MWIICLEIPFQFIWNFDMNPTFSSLDFLPTVSLWHISTGAESPDSFFLCFCCCCEDAIWYFLCKNVGALKWLPFSKLGLTSVCAVWFLRSVNATPKAFIKARLSLVVSAIFLDDVLNPRYFMLQLHKRKLSTTRCSCTLTETYHAKWAFNLDTALFPHRNQTWRSIFTSLTQSWVVVKSSDLFFLDHDPSFWAVLKSLQFIKGSVHDVAVLLSLNWRSRSFPMQMNSFK